MKPEITIVPYASAAYIALLNLRDTELRIPLGLKFTPEELAKDEHDTHIAVMYNGEVVGGVIVTLHDDDNAQLRQMVVSSDHQRMGLGKLLLNFAEDYIREKGFGRIELNARVNAQDFYEKAGYEAIGTGFTQATLPHIRMTKQLR